MYHVFPLFLVVGCAEPEVPGGAKWDRRGDTAYVTCNATGTKWELKCYGNKWKGKQGNCTESECLLLQD